MKSMDSTEAKTNFGALLDAAQRGPVQIKKKGRAVAVMVSDEDFATYEKLKLEALQRELMVGLDASARGDVVDGKKFMARLRKKYSG